VEETDGIDSMRLVCEVAEAGDALADRIGEAVRAACGLRAEVRLVAPGSLPNDGKVIDDRRPAP
jgi:phenylacetate-CoA ligase